jgi:hypothetical protein
MKRQKQPLRSGPLVADIRKDIPEPILIGVGTVALAYNEAEAYIDNILSFAASLRVVPLDIISRINGADGKVEIVKAAFRALDANDEIQRLIATSLGQEGFLLFKQYRDAVIHARQFNLIANVADTLAKRGQRYEVLITKAALDGLYERLALLAKELFEMRGLAITLTGVRDCDAFLKYAIDADIKLDQHQLHFSDLRKANIEQDIQVATARYQDRLKRRLSLPPLPKFPSESELREAHQQWFQASVRDHWAT